MSSEIADELDRLAKKLDARAREAAQLRDDSQFEMEAQHQSGSKIAYAQAAIDLRERAAELRAQRSEPTYKPQPKPAEVRAGQWWMFEGDVTRVLGRCDPDVRRNDVVLPRDRGGLAEMQSARHMLSSSLWLYLGDGPLPAT
jgi:hypothetical protein